MTRPEEQWAPSPDDPAAAKIELLGINSVAILLDEARDLLVAARDRGELPETFVVEPDMLDQLRSIRQVQLALTGAVAIFGLRVVARRP